MNTMPLIFISLLAQAAPDPVTGLDAVPGIESVTLSWTNSNAEGIDVYYSATGEITQEFIDFGEATWAGSVLPLGAPGSRQSHVVAGLPAGDRIYFAVVAFMTTGAYGGVSPSVWAVPAADSIPPSAVADLTVEAVTDTSVRLGWTPAGDDGDAGRATGYEVRMSLERPVRDDATFEEATPVGGISGPDGEPRVTLTVTGLRPGTPLFFALKAGDGRLWGPLSNPASATTLPPTGQADSWNEPAPMPIRCEAGAAIIAASDPDRIHVFPGGGRREIFERQGSTGQWSLGAALPFDQTAHGAYAALPGTPYIYCVEGDRYYYPGYLPGPRFGCFNIETRTFIPIEGQLPSTVDPDHAGPLYEAPVAAFPTSTDAKVALAGTTDAIFAAGPAGEGLWMLTRAQDPGAIHAWVQRRPLGRDIVSLAWPGSGDFLYAITETDGIWIYSMSGDTWGQPNFNLLKGLMPGPRGMMIPGAPGSLMILQDIFGDLRLHRYSPNQGSEWAPVSIQFPALAGDGVGLAVRARPGGDTIHYMPGGGTHLWSGPLLANEGRFPTSLALAQEPIRDGASCAMGPDGAALYVLEGGGRKGFWRYSFAENMWSGLPETPDPLTSASALAFGLDGHLYAVREASAEVWRYSIDDRTWSRDAVAPLAAPAGRTPSLVAVAPGRLVVNPGIANSLQEYSPATNTWIPRSVLMNPETILVYPGRGGLLYTFHLKALRAYSIAHGLADVDEDGTRPLHFPESPLPAGNDTTACFGPGGRTLFLAGASGSALASYSFASRTWTSLASPPGQLGGVRGGLAFPPGQGCLFALPGRSSRVLWSYRRINLVPRDPIALRQVRVDAVTELPADGSIADGAVILEADLDDPDGDPLRLEVRLRPTGVSFDEAPDGIGPETPAGSSARVMMPRLATDTRYRWQARALDALGAVSEWISFGSNPDQPDETDFRTRRNAPPRVMRVRQLAAGGWDLSPGDKVIDPQVIITALIEDEDGDAVTLEIEVVPTGGRFTGNPSATGTGAAGEIWAVIPLARNGTYSWKYRGRDAAGGLSAWASFGGDDLDPDFEVVLAGGSVNGGACSATPRGDGLLVPALLIAGVLCRRRGIY